MAGRWVALLPCAAFGALLPLAHGTIAAASELALEVDTADAQEASCLLQRDHSHRSHADMAGASAVVVRLDQHVATDATAKAEASHESLASKEHKKQAALLLATQAKGLSEGLDYAASQILHSENMTVEDYEGSNTTATVFHKRSKTVLAVLEFCPLFWMLGLDRLYLGNTGMGILKFVLCVCTCGGAGLIWGIIDLIIVVFSCLRKDLVLNCFGMHAVFAPDQVEPAFIIILIEIVSIPFIVILFRFVMWWRAENRRRLLAERAQKSPDYGKTPDQIAAEHGMGAGAK